MQQKQPTEINGRWGCWTVRGLPQAVARGKITEYSYNEATGTLAQMVQDPSGLNLITDYESDEMGRTVKILGPEHNVNGQTVRTIGWTVYLDDHREVRTAQGYRIGASNDTLVNPVSLQQMDESGRVIDQIQATRGSGVENSGELTAADTFSQSSWTRWTHSKYGNDGRLESTDSYHKIPASGSGASGTNYDRTEFGYDSMGRQNKVTSPGQTISKTVFDSRSLVTETQVGTVDGGGSDNMRAVSKNIYDGGNDGGDGLLTKVTSPVDGTIGNDREVEYEYDWRDRQTTSISTDGTNVFYAVATLDNLGRATVSQQYHNGTTSTDRIGKSEAFYDDRGQVFQSKRYAVSDSGVTGNSLEENTWFDAAGNVLKSKPAGSDSFTKMVYDAVGRTTDSYTAYYDGTGTDSPNNLTDNIVLEESNTTYDDASNVTFATTKSRWHDATDTGPLNGPSGSQPKSRDSYSAMWQDGVGRGTATADYGTNNNAAAPSRPNSAPASSDTILVSKTVYYPAGEVEDQTDPKNEVSTSVYDNLGRITKITQNSTGTEKEITQTAYTSSGQVKTLAATNATTGDQITTYVYGVTLTNSEIASNDLLANVEYPGTGTDRTVTYEYNRQGQQLKLTDQNGSVHEYEYDALGRQTEDKVSTLGTGVDGFVKRIQQTYDNRLRLENVTSHSATTGGTVRSEVQNAYNDFSQMKTEYQQHGAAVNTGTSPKVQFGYANGSGNTIRRTSVTYPNANVLDFEYGSGASDELSRVEKLTWDSTDVVKYDYLGANQVVIQKYPEPSTDVEYTLATGSGSNPYAGLDRFGRVIDLQWKQSSTELVRLKYGYDRAGNREYRRDEVARTNSKKFDELYQYDGLNRLDDFDRGELNSGNTALVGSPTLAQGWTLDQTGNWSGFNQTVQNALTQTRTHNTVNEITAIAETVGDQWKDPAHDNNGNMTTIPQPKDLTKGYTATWDAWNRLVKLTNDADGDKTVAEFEYDGNNRRITKTVGSTVRHFYYSDQWQVLEERIDSATTADRQFVWGLRYVDDLVLRDKGSERLYALQDANFNVVALTNDTGTIKQRFAYQPYGEPEELNPNFTTYTGTDYNWNYRFTGRELDLNTGLQLNRNRYYHQQLGRWVNRDPIDYRGSRWNLYLYAQASPVVQTDSHGLLTDEYLSRCCANAGWKKKCDLTGCGVFFAPPLPPSPGPPGPGTSCNYGGLRVWTPLGSWSLQCVCRCAGNSPGMNCVRGCIQCARNNGAPVSIWTELWCKSSCNLTYKESKRLNCCLQERGGCYHPNTTPGSPPLAPRGACAAAYPIP